MPRRYFTVEQANTLIPDLKRQLTEALQLHRHLRGFVGELTDSDHEVTWAMLRGELELEDAGLDSQFALERARAVYDLLRGLVEGMENRFGVDIRGIVDGVVAFPTWMDGEREVELSWRLGDEQVDHWHELDDEPDARRSIEGHNFSGEPEEAQAQLSQ